MALHYLYPCPNCEHKFELVQKQAGQELLCPSCETTISVPKLGILKQLEPVNSASDSNSATNPNRDSNPRSWRNALFVSGLALAVLAGAAGFGLYHFAQSKVIEFDVEGRLAEVDKWIDEQPPTNVLGTYVTMDVGKGLPEWVEQPHIGSNKQAAILKNFAFGLLGLSAIGLLTLVSSFLVPR